jgi:hypothetical protein
MHRQAATKVANYVDAYLKPTGLMQTGYSPSGEITEPDQPDAGNAGGSPLYPKNLNTYVSDNRQEASNAFYDTLSQSKNSFKDETIATLKISESRQRQDTIESTVTRKNYDDFMSGGKEMSSDEWWSTFTNIFDPTRPNNPRTAYTLAQREQNLAKDKAEDLALKEYSAGGGFLPTRKCVTFTPDKKTCLDWQTDTPGQIIAKTSADALGAKLQEYLDPALGKIGNGNEPITTDIGTFTPSAGTGGGTSGWEWLTGIGDGGDSDGDGKIDTGLPPIVFIYASNLDVNTRRINWTASNVASSSCKAKNDWIGGAMGSINDTDETSLVTIIKSRGQILPAKAFNEITFPIPLNFIPSWSKDGINYTKTGLVANTNLAGTSIEYVWNIPAPVKNTDSYFLKIQDGDNTSGTIIAIGGANVPITPFTTKRVVEMFKNYQTTNPNAAIYRRYKFAYNGAGNTPNIRITLPEPKYEITCTGKNGGSASASTE